MTAVEPIDHDGRPVREMRVGETGYGNEKRRHEGAGNRHGRVIVIERMFAVNRDANGLSG